jgi:hypothetical protein
LLAEERLLVGATASKNGSPERGSISEKVVTIIKMSVLDRK